MSLSALVDLSSFRYDNDQVLFEDLIINPSTCGLDKFKISLGDKPIDLWTL